MHRQTINRGRVAYEPNSLGGGCPFQAGAAGFVSFPARAEKNDHKVRGKAERFADHYTQATLFFNSQTPVEQQHIINAFRFELSKVQVPAIRERMVSSLMNVSEELAEAVAEGLGITEMPAPMPKVMQKKVRAEVAESKPLSLFARRGNVGIQTRRIAMLDRRRRERRSGAGDCGADPRRRRGAGVRRAEARRGESGERRRVQADASLEVAPSVVFDAVVIPDGEATAAALAANGRALEFVKDQYRHCKAMLVAGAATLVLDKAGIPGELPTGDPDSGMIIGSAGVDTRALDAFVSGGGAASPLRARIGSAAGVIALALHLGD